MDISLVLSILAIAGSVTTYLIHDKRLKSQEARINDYELSKIDNEKKDALKAKVRANSYKSGPGRQIVKIFNSGQAIAKNIRIEFTPADYDGYIQKNQFPFKYLNPQDFTEISMILVSEMPDTIEIKMMWDDEFSLDNDYSQIITL